jgi:hypothetical protein
MHCVELVCRMFESVECVELWTILYECNVFFCSWYILQIQFILLNEQIVSSDVQHRQHATTNCMVVASDNTPPIIILLVAGHVERHQYLLVVVCHAHATKVVLKHVTDRLFCTSAGWTLARWNPRCLEYICFATWKYVSCGQRLGFVQLDSLCCLIPSFHSGHQTTNILSSLATMSVSRER